MEHIVFTASSRTIENSDKLSLNCSYFKEVIVETMGVKLAIMAMALISIKALITLILMAISKEKVIVVIRVAAVAIIAAMMRGMTVNTVSAIAW